MLVENDACETCGGYRTRSASTPKMPCYHCDPDGYFGAQVAYLDAYNEDFGPRTELILFGRPMDRLQQVYTYADELGGLYTIHASYYPITAVNRDRIEGLVTECQKLKEENRDLLAENARLRRRLER